MGVERIAWKRKGFRDLRRSREIVSDLTRRGRAIADASGPGVEVSPFTGKNRGRVSVIAIDQEARRDNAENDTLIRNLNAGR